MAGILGAELGRRALTLIANETVYTPTNLVVRLYTNSIVPTPNDILALYTECVAAGYAPINVFPGSWADSIIGGGGQIAVAGLTFNFSAGVTLMGYYLTDPANTLFMGGELFAVPIVVPSFGGILLLSVDLQVITC